MKTFLLLPVLLAEPEPETVLASPFCKQNPLVYGWNIISVYPFLESLFSADFNADFIFIIFCYVYD